MKTLDEVIEAQERCSTYPNCHFCFLHSGPICEWIMDALQYLKWYKELADDSEEFAEWKENPPLTWDELRTMEGKPVWVEYAGGGDWMLVDKMNELNNNWIQFRLKNGRLFRVSREESVKVVYRDGHHVFQRYTWQAYRKERS